MTETKTDLEAYILNVVLENQGSSPNDLASAITDMLTKCPGAPAFPEKATDAVLEVLNTDDRVDTPYPASMAMTILRNVLPVIRPVDLAGWGDIDD